MGVPRLYKWLTDAFPRNIYRFPVCSKINWVNLPVINEGKQPDNLYIDGVSIVHNFSARVFKYGDHAIKEGETDEYAEYSYKKKVETVYSMSTEYVISLIKTVNPKYLAYVSFDGVAPLAKQGQQRQRRFVSAKSREESRAKFDSNTITAGSNFTYNFCIYAKYTLLSRMAMYKEFKHLKIIFSSSNVPGEGEHKIMDYIRAISKNGTSLGGRHVLYGPDGDLIMLALCTHRKDFWIIRENFFDMSKFDLVDMGSIYKNIVVKLSDGIKLQCNERNVIHDFVLIGFFLGNDFLPKIQMIDMLEKGLETFISKYTKIKKERSIDREWTLTDNGEIMQGNFQHFINTLAGLEKFFLMSQLNLKISNEKFTNHTLLNSCQKNEDNETNFDYQLYDELYTNGKLGVHPDLAVDKYFFGLQWVLKYYTSGCPDWRWIYSYHHAPLMKHMSSAVKDTRLKTARFNQNSAVEPFRQMMCVIPPLSKKVLHKNLRFIYTHKDLQQYYPSTFQMDYEGKKQDWQGIALLPFIDQHDMDKVYESVADEFFNVKENRITKNIIFHYDEDACLNYNSKYGSLVDVPVVVNDIDC